MCGRGNSNANRIATGNRHLCDSGEIVWPYAQIESRTIRAYQKFCFAVMRELRVVCNLRSLDGRDQ